MLNGFRARDKKISQKVFLFFALLWDALWGLKNIGAVDSGLDSRWIRLRYGQVFRVPGSIIEPASARLCIYSYNTGMQIWIVVKKSWKNPVNCLRSPGISTGMCMGGRELCVCKFHYELLLFGELYELLNVWSLPFQLQYSRTILFTNE